MATRGRAPVKVGAGFIEIYPELSKIALARLRTDLTTQLTAMGKAGAAAFSKGLTGGFNGIATATSKAAKQAGKATEKEAVDTSNKLRQIERSLTRFHGEEAGKQFRTYRNLAKQREQLEEGTSKATRKAITDTVKANRQAVQEAIRDERQKAQEKARAEKEARAETTRRVQAERKEERALAAEVAQIRREQTAQLRAQAQERARLQREAMAETRRRVQAERTEERALAREVSQMKRELAAAARRAAAEQRAAERELAAAVRQRVAEERAAHQARVAFLRDELRGLQQTRSAYADVIASNRRQIASWDRQHRTSMRSAGEQWKSLSQTTETYGQNLEQVGRSITQNLVTPLAIAAGYVTKIGATSADMQFYSSEGLNRAGFNQKEVAKGLQSIQDFAVHTPFSLEDMTDKFSQVARNFESYGNSTSDSLKKSRLLIKGIADYAASFGITNPEKVKGGMMAADMMMDQGKLSTRYLRQFVRGTGIPMNEIGKIAGFKGGPDFLKEVQDPKGGVNSKEFFDKFIKAYQTAPGVKGSAEALGTGSIGGHFTSVKEQMQLTLGKLFGEYNDSGKFEWTELGQNTHKLADRLKDLVEDPDFQKLAGGLSGNLLKALNLLLGGVEKTQALLNEHPWLKDLVAKAVKVVAVLGPLAIAIGLATKILGKVGKSFLPLLKLTGGLAKGVRGAFRTGNQFLSGVAAGKGNFREAYQARRADYHDGDDRSLARRGMDRMRGQDSRSTRLTVETSDAERALRDVDQTIQQIQSRIYNLNRARLNSLSNELGGEAGSSVKGGAQNADREIDQARLSVRELNRSPLSELGQRLISVKEKAGTAQSGIKQVRQAVNDLNEGKLGMVRQQFEFLKDKADTAKRYVAQVAAKVQELNGRSLDSLRAKFSSNLTPAIKDSYSKAKGLNDKIKDVNGRGLGQITSKVRTLRDALDQAEGKAGALGGKLGEVNRLTGFGGGGGGKGKGNKHALGGIVPGYAPGVDNYHAILSPGEAVLRPEIANALGSDTINAWNSAAARGRVSRHAKGKAGEGSSKTGTWPLSILEELYDIVNVRPGIGAFTGGIGMAGAGQTIGGPTGSNVRHWGAQAGGDGAGRLVNNRFGKMKDFILERVPSFLTKAPTGIGNLIGIAAGGIAPTAGQLFWDDVWKGEGNVLQRGGRFMTDMVKSIPQILKDLVSNVWDSGAEILGALKDAITDPVGFFEDALSSVKSMFQGMVDQVKEMVRLLQEIWSNPSEYAEEVFDNFVVRVKELMPNTKGLFQFADGGIVPGYSPGNDRVHAMLSPGEAVLRPEAVRFLGHAAIQRLNSGAKSGTLSTASKLESDTSIPDAKAYEEVVAKIIASLEDLTKAVAAHRSSSAADWDQVATKVRTAIDGTITPAQTRWVQHLSGPLAQTERAFQSTNQGVWSDVQNRVSASVSDVSSSLTQLRSNVDTTKRFFETSGSQIRTAWGQAMSYVDSSTRTTVSGPYNRGAVSMMSAMAKLAGTGPPLSPVQFSTGGIVPGYQPGVDTVPAVLSKGEGILRPEVVRSLGAETILRWNEQARRGGHVYARGGIVGQAAFTGPTGADWVNKHKDDDFDGYTSAFKAGWQSVIKPMLDTVTRTFGVSGDLSARGFDKGRPWAEKWTKWVDDHTSGGGGAAVKVALDEHRNEAPMVGGSKYNLGNGEAWCADFISYVVDKAGANSAYGNSPKGAPRNRWPAVATWNAAMRHVPVSQSQPGDLMTYQGNGHINIKTGPDETVGGNESNQLKRSRGYWRSATAALRPTGGNTSVDGPVLNAWPGSIPKFTGSLGGGVDGEIAKAIAKAMSLTGVGGSKWSDGIATIIRRESGGNARAVNDWDSNAVVGNSSKGLMQVVPTTFKAYHQSGTSWDIFDPVANIAAAINYIKARYGDISRVQQADPTKPPKGYWTGTQYASPGLALVGERGPELVNFRGGERVYNNGETRDLLGNRYEIHIHEAKAEDTTQAVIRGLQYVETMYGM
ncbi:tape measure protein [Streptomyces sp. NBC_01216]|uniref:transglycosylase SLT domain-containing protein n=1 Tax=Streptomyces sp. NBC_01216 TaxID=2903778 RepID=UPI002E124BE0|nr:tape measure protein [Streptomyces sp. NBC_01216]